MGVWCTILSGVSLSSSITKDATKDVIQAKHPQKYSVNLSKGSRSMSNKGRHIKRNKGPFSLSSVGPCAMSHKGSRVMSSPQILRNKELCSMGN